MLDIVNEKILRGWVKRHVRHSLPAVTVRDPWRKPEMENRFPKRLIW